MDFFFFNAEPNYGQGCCPAISQGSTLAAQGGYQATFHPSTSAGTCTPYAPTM